MGELRLALALLIVQICCNADLIYAADEKWVTDLYQRIENLEKQGVKQSSINTRQKQMLDQQARQLEHTNDLVKKLEEVIAAKTLQLEKQRVEIGDLNQHVYKLLTQVLTCDVLMADMEGLQAELDEQRVPKTELLENVANQMKINITLSTEKADELMKKPNIYMTDPTDNKTKSITKTKTDRQDTKYNSDSPLIKRQNRFVLNREGPFAFHAVSDKHEIPHIQIDQSILFGTVLLNIGGAYHSNHSLFIAEIPGVYLFSASILSYVNAHSEYTAALVKNGANLALIYGHGDAGRHDQGSVTVVTQLNAGDEVWVKLLSSADDSIYGGRYTTFSGVLLYNL